jgi:hypothetical protein
MSSTTLNPPPPTPVRGTRIVVADLVRELNDALPPKPAGSSTAHADRCVVCADQPGCDRPAPGVRRRTRGRRRRFEVDDPP